MSVVILSRLHRDERGAVVAFVAALLVVLVGFSALAIDVGRLYVTRAKLQTAADSAALAAVGRLPDQNAAQSAALGLMEQNLAAGEQAGQHGAGAITFGRWDPTTRVFLANATPIDAVRVAIGRTTANGSPIETFFARVLGQDEVDVAVTSIARASRPPTCILALDPTVSGAFDVGNGTVTANGCAVHVNSNAAQALTGAPNGRLATAQTCVRGGYRDRPTYDPAPLTGCPQLADPLAELAEPAVGACTHYNVAITAGGGTLSPGVYCGGIDISSTGTVTLQPGLYVIKDGPFALSGGANLIAHGVTLYFTGANAYLDTSGGGQVSMSAPTSGTYAGIMVFGSRSLAASTEHALKGSSAVHYEGTIYFPTTRVRFTGNGAGATSSPYSLFIARTFRFEGNGEIQINPDYDASDVPLAAEVGSRDPQLVM
jgi:hypothetical protein